MKNSALPWAVAAKQSLVKTCPSSFPLPPFIIPFVVLDYNLIADSSGSLYRMLSVGKHEEAESTQKQSCERPAQVLFL